MNDTAIRGINGENILSTPEPWRGRAVMSTAFLNSLAIVLSVLIVQPESALQWAATLGLWIILALGLDALLFVRLVRLSRPQGSSPRVPSAETEVPGPL